MWKLRNIAIPVVGALATLLLFSGVAQADDIPPAGIGDLMPTVGESGSKGHQTLFEKYGNIGLYTLDRDLSDGFMGMGDIADKTGNLIASIILTLLAVVGYACIVITRWVFNVTSLPELSDAISNTIAAASGSLIKTLFPAAMVVGVLVAFGNSRKAHGSGLSQIAWVLAAGVLSVSLLTTPKVWVDGVDSVRQIGSSVALDTAAGGMSSGNTDINSVPFKIKEDPKYGAGSGRNAKKDAMLRKASDTVWRTFVVTPWCVADLGSMKVCDKYGAGLLKEIAEDGGDEDDRNKWLGDHVNEETVGEKSEKWRQGHNPWQRIGILIPSLIVAIIFAGVALLLAFASLASLLGALMLLVAGVIFACLWMIPGRPRQWGLKWFDQLLGYTLQSFVCTLTLACIMILTTAIANSFDKYGWLPCAGLSVATALVGAKFRGIVESIISSGSPLSSGIAGEGMRSAQRKLRSAKSGTRSGKKAAGKAAFGASMAGIYGASGVKRGATWGANKIKSRGGSSGNSNNKEMNEKKQNQNNPPHQQDNQTPSAEGNKEKRRNQSTPVTDKRNSRKSDPGGTDQENHTTRERPHGTSKPPVREQASVSSVGRRNQNSPSSRGPETANRSSPSSNTASGRKDSSHTVQTDKKSGPRTYRQAPQAKHSDRLSHTRPGSPTRVSGQGSGRNLRPQTARRFRIVEGRRGHRQ